MKLYENYEICKENFKFHLTNEEKCSVRKQTGGDEKMGKQAGEEGKRDCEKNGQICMFPNLNSWLHHCAFVV